MSESIKTKSEANKPPRNRLIWGTIVFVSGFLTPLFIPLVVSSELSTGLKSIISGLLAFGIPELFMIIAAGILGKQGFNYLKRYLRLLLKVYGPADTVSKTRYGIGLIMFIIPLGFALILPYLITAIGFVKENYLIVAIGSDLLLVLSLFVLGGDFWDKLRGLFIYNAKISISKNRKNEKNIKSLI